MDAFFQIPIDCLRNFSEQYHSLGDYLRNPWMHSIGGAIKSGNGARRNGLWRVLAKGR